MKKILKVIISFFLILLMLSSFVFATNSNKFRKKDVNIFNLVIITFQDKLYFDGQNTTVSAQEKISNNVVVGIFGSLLLIYWLALLFLFEKEETYDYTYDCEGDLELLKKYNPMVAGCLVQNRDVLPRDVTAVVLNLIQKNVISMKMVPKENGKDDYIYMISYNKNSSVALDEIESYVLSWLFGFYEDEEIDLIKKLKELSKNKDFLIHMKKVNTITQKELHKMGANLNFVPLTLRIINFFVLFFTIFVTVIHVTNNGLNIHIYESTIWLILFIIIGVVIIIPVIALAIHLILLFIAFLNRTIKIVNDIHSGRQIISMIICILVFLTIFVSILYFTIPDKYLCLDVIIIGIAILIIKTDNLMTKHSKEILNDYYCMQEIKYKIEEYSLIKDEQINYMKLWDEYLIYAVAFGIPIPIINKVKITYNQDEDIKYLLKAECLYYICKAYLEVMWEMNFKEKKHNTNNLFKLNKLIKENNFGGKNDKYF